MGNSCLIVLPLVLVALWLGRGGAVQLASLCPAAPAAGSTGVHATPGARDGSDDGAGP